ncbi:metallophosphoesterase, partial [Candidatus Puniceispirillum sp.]|uniref:metallophosphoesterase n=1 Tax=Candidatus Puniceispirillum sp. TaxID=2026719 RepID=UPI003F69F14E
MRNFIFATIIFILSFLIYIYPLNIVAYLLFDARLIQPVTIIPTAIIALTIFVYFKTHITSPLLSTIIYYGMGIGFIGFCIFNIGLIAALIMPEFSFEIGLFCLIVFVITCVKSILNGRYIHLKNIHITSPKIDQPSNLLFISDVHLGSNSKQHFERICQTIDKLDYDFLLIGGDLFDSSAFNAADLSPLKVIEKPILFVTGNHEYYVKDHQAKVADL